MTDSGLLLLDTTVVLHLARGNDTGKALDKAYGLRNRPDRPLISIVTVGEMLCFAKGLGWGRTRVDRLEELIAELVVVDIRNRAVLEKYAEINTFAVKHGRTLGNNDVWIAATAAATGAVLLTNDKDFDPLHDKFLSRICVDPTVR